MNRLGTLPFSHRAVYLRPAPPGPDATGVGGGGGCGEAGGSPGPCDGSPAGGSRAGGGDWRKGDGAEVAGGAGIALDGATSDETGGAFLALVFNRSKAVVAALRTSSFLS